MLPRLLLFLLIAYATWKVYQYIQRLPPTRRRKATMQVCLYGLIGLLILLTITGRLHWIGAAIALVLPLVKWLSSNALRFFPVLATLFPKLKMGPSIFTSRTLKLSIEVKTSSIDGDILEGPLQGKRLSELNSAQIDELLAYCQQHDSAALRLANFYFRNQASHNRRESAVDTGTMDRKEALSILGLSETATERDIVAAHRRLMQKVHPDRGGSDYLAARVNLAKDILLQQ